MEQPNIDWSPKPSRVLLSYLANLWRQVSTNKLFTLRQRKWVEKYLPMNTARDRPAVVSTSDGDYVIVIGGSDIGRLRQIHWTH